MTKHSAKSSAACNQARRTRPALRDANRFGRAPRDAGAREVLDYRHRFQPLVETSQPKSPISELITPRLEAEVYCNCKTEHYPSFTKTTVADKPVFKSPSWELRADPRRKKRARTAPDPNNEPQPRSVHRAKKRVFDIAALNSFRYFVTLTLDPKKIDRENAHEVAKKLKTFLAHKVRRCGLSYILVPEFHKDRKGIHMHGLVSGDIRLKASGIKTRDGRTVYNLPDWTFGFSTCIELTGDTQFAARYITKYISKDFKKVFGNFYYAGGGISRRPPTTYSDADYDAFEAKPYEVPEIGVSFKYGVCEGV